MNATSALLQANHRITELQAEARQARLAAEVRRSGQPAGRAPLARRLVRVVGQLLHRAHRRGQILAT
jgi:hypothetical protein